MKKLLNLALFCAGVAGLAPLPAAAQEPFASSPITIVVPFSPGGATDTTARLLAKKMAEESGYQFIVENKPGAGGGIAAQYIARAKPDGHSLLFATTNTNGINSYIYPNLSYDAVDSFTPVGFVAENVVVLLANSSFPANNLADALTELKAHPGQYSYASPGVGTVHQAAMELLKHKEGLDVLHIPYKGAGPAMIDLVAGTVPLMMGGIAPALPFIASGKVKVLAVANDRRFKNVPADVQYFSDVAPGTAVSSWMGLLAPKGTPSADISKLSDALRKALASKELTDALEQQGMQSEYMSPDQFGKLIADGMVFWKTAAQTIKLEQN